MEIINLPRLRVKQLQLLGEESVRICRSISEVQTEVEQVKTELTEYIEGMTRESISAEEKLTLDKERDFLISGFMRDVKAESYFPYTDAATIDNLKSLLAIVNKYGSSIIRLSQNEETVAVDNFLEEFSQTNIAAFQTSGLSRWIPLIEAANTNFKEKAQSYIAGNATLSQTTSASELAPGLTSSLESLYKKLYAYYIISPSDTLLSAYTQINTLLASFN